MPSRLGPFALAYHGVGDVPLRDDPAGLFTSPSRLRRHIRVLRSWGYQFVTFGELAARVRAGDGNGYAALTFDDGLADNFHALLPILEVERARATVFVVSSWLGTAHPDANGSMTLNRDELRALAAAGPVEIGSHSATHRNLAALSFEEVREDFRRSREELAEVIGRPVDVAAYPFGLATMETQKACEAAGFVAACRISGLGSWSEPFNLPRQDMANGANLLGLRLKRDGHYEPLMALASGRVLRGGARRLRATWQRPRPSIH